MFMNKKIDKAKIDIKSLNDVIALAKNIFKILYILLFVGGVYILTMIAKEWNVWAFILQLLKIVSPLFIGIVIAWLFDPFIKWLEKKGIRRKIGAVIAYLLLIGVLSLILGSILPLLYNQITDFVNVLPEILDTIMGWLDSFFMTIDSKAIDVEAIKEGIYDSIETFGSDLTQSLPGMLISFIGGFFSLAGVFLVGLIIGFFLIISFDSTENLITFLPKKLQADAKGLSRSVNVSLRRFVEGAILDSTLIFVVSSLGLWLVGLKAPLLFGLFCGITNIIPYAGPYIGGVPAVIVGFSQNTTVGLFTLLVIAVIQFLEGNFLQPLIMAKTTRLHPVTIILGLLVFGYFWGIIGMAIATPVIAAFKSIFLYFDEKYNFFTLNDEE